MAITRSIARSLVRNLSRRIVPVFDTRGYIVQGLVGDWTSEVKTQIQDLSGNNNPMTVNTGIYASSNGSTDKILNADCSGLGVGDYYGSGMARSATAGTKHVLIGNTPVTFEITAVDVWQQVTTTVAENATPSVFTLGWDGGTGYSACDFSDWKLHGHPDKTPHWTMITGAGSSSLNNVPELDSSGNGYHGVNIGGAGGSGEADILQTAGMDFNKGGGIHYTSDFSSGKDGWGGNSTTVTGNIDADADGVGVPPSDNWLKGAVSGTGDRIRYIIPKEHFPVGLYKVSFDLYVPAGDPSIGYSWSSSSSTLGVSLSPSTIQEGLQTYEGTIEVYDTTAYWFLGITASGTSNLLDSVWYIKNFVSENYQGLLVPASDANPSLDALGNPIDNPRPNDKVLNLSTGTGYAEIADSDSLDLTTEATWEIWGNFYGTVDTQQTLFSKYATNSDQRSWSYYKPDDFGPDEIAVRISGDGTAPTEHLISGFEDAHQQFVAVYENQILKYYIDGVYKGEVSGVDSPISASSSPIALGCIYINEVASQLSTFPIGSPKISNRALTADEIKRNYNAQCESYGLTKI